MAIIRKQIAYSLVIEGETITSLEQLRQFPSVELLQLHAGGQLCGWLRKNGGAAEAEKLDDLVPGENKPKDLAYICNVLGMDVDIDDIRGAITEMEQKPLVVDTSKVKHEMTDVYAHTDESSVFLINTVKDRLTEFFAKLQRAKGQIPSCADFIKTNRPITSLCGGTIVLFDHMGTVRAKGVSPGDPNDFNTGAVSLFRSSDEINIESLHSDFIIADDIKNLVLGDVYTRYALIRAENVYIGGTRGDDYSGQEKREICIIANNVFIGNSGLTNRDSQFSIHCRDKLIFGFDFKLDDIPFGKNENELAQHMQNLREEYQANNEAFRNTEVGRGVMLLGGFIGLLCSGGTQSNPEKMLMKNGVVSASHYIGGSEKLPMTAYPSSMARSFHSELTAMFSEWVEKENVFSKKFWVK